MIVHHLHVFVFQAVDVLLQTQFCVQKIRSILLTSLYGKAKPSSDIACAYLPALAIKYNFSGVMKKLERGLSSSDARSILLHTTVLVMLFSPVLF